jgi:hypothetical protein
MMGLAAAAWHWSPADFRASTPHEWWAAYEAMLEMNKLPDEGEVK